MSVYELFERPSYTEASKWKTEKQKSDDAISNSALQAETYQVVMAALPKVLKLFCHDALPDATNDLYKF